MSYRVSAGLVLVTLLMLGAAACTANTPLSFNTTDEYKTESFSEPVEGAESVEVTLRMPSESMDITALEDSANLFEADVEFIGVMEFDTSGGASRRISLWEDNQSKSYNGTHNLQWDVRLRQGIPTSLNVDVSSGSLSADLADLDLTGLDVNLSSGSVSVALPAYDGGTRIAVDVSSGSVSLRIPEGAVVDFDGIELSSGSVNVTAGEGVGFATSVDVSSGTVRFALPDDAPVRVSAEWSSGGVDVPPAYRRVSGSDDDREGVYESPSFAEADTDAQIVLTVSVSSGQVIIE
jgi:hypothetical protein